MSDQQKGEDRSLDHVLLWPVLERVSRGVVTVRISEYGWPWYYEDDRHCPFGTYLLEKLIEQGYTRWDSYIEGPHGGWIVRDDGVSAVKLDDKGHELHKRLSEERRAVADRDPDR